LTGFKTLQMPTSSLKFPWANQSHDVGLPV